MKIAVFTDSYRPYVSGVVRSIETFTQEFLSLGHHVYIFAPRYYWEGPGESRGRRPAAGGGSPAAALGRGALEGSGALPDEQPGGDDDLAGHPGLRIFRYWSVPVPMYAGFTLPVPISPHIDQLVARLGVDIVHSHTPFLMGRLGALVARRRRLPLVFTHHTLYHEYVHYVPGIQGLARRLVLRHVKSYCRGCQLIVAPTPQIRRFISHAYKVRVPIVSIPTGIRLEAWERGNPQWLRETYGIGRDRKVLIFVGRLGREKNVDLLLDAFEIVTAEQPETMLVLVGDGPERTRLQQKALRKGLGGRVVFTGTLDKRRVIDAYLGSDLFFFASVTETQGLVTLEAMAAGLPVAAVDAPGTRDMVQHGRQGLLSEATAASLARQALTILRDPQLASHFSREAKARARQFSARRQALDMLAAYESLLSAEGAPVPSAPQEVRPVEREYSS